MTYNETNKIINELNAIKRALGLTTFNDDISVYGRLSRVETSASENLQTLDTKTYIINSNIASLSSNSLEVTSSDNPFFINGVLLQKGIDYQIIDSYIISFNYTLNNNTEVTELVGSFVQQNRLEFQYFTLDGSTTIVEVSSSDNPFFIDGKNIQPQEYNKLSSYQIELLTTYPNGTVLAELLGGGKDGTDGVTPIKGIDYFDGLDAPQYRGIYDNTILYPKDTLIKFNDAIYISLNDTQGNDPSTSSWELFVKSGTMQYLEGDLFPDPIGKLGSFFKKTDGGLYVCVDSAQPFWQQIGA